MNEDIETAEKMRIANKSFKKLNGEQYMRLYIKIILKIQIYFRMLLSTMYIMSKQTTVYITGCEK